MGTNRRSRPRMQADAVAAIRADDAKVFPRCAWRWVGSSPFPAECGGQVVSAGADELIAERIGDTRIGKGAYAGFDLLPFFS